MGSGGVGEVCPNGVAILVDMRIVVATVQQSSFDNRFQVEGQARDGLDQHVELIPLITQ